MKKGLLILLTSISSVACFNTTDKNTASKVPEFVKIVDGETIIDDSSIICEISLEELPTHLTFDNGELADNAKEYEWGVYFDHNNDGVYDLSLSVANWKSTQDTAREVKILENTQSNVWSLHDKGGTRIDELDAKIEGDKLIMMLDNLKSVRSQISSDSKIMYKTYYDNGHETFIDSLLMIN